MAFTPKTWQNSPSTATPTDAAALIDLETRVSGYSDTVGATKQDLAAYENALATDVLFASPGNLPIYRGTFTPVGATVEVEVHCSGMVHGLARATAVLYYGPTGQAQLAPPTQSGSSSPAGTSYVVLPGLSAYAGYPVDANDNPLALQPANFSWSKTLTGLTPGVQRAWEFNLGIVGGASAESVGTGTTPDVPAISIVPDAMGYRRSAVRNNGDDTATIGLLGTALQHPNDTPLWTVTLPAGSGQVAVSHLGTWALATNSTANSVTLINLATGAAQTVAMPDVGATPKGVAAFSPLTVATTDPTNDGKFFVLGTNSKLYRFDASTVSFNATAPYPVTGMPASLERIAVNSNNTEAICTNPASRQICKVNLSAGTFTNTTLATNSGGFQGAIYTPAGAQPVVWLVGTNGTSDNYFCGFTTTTNTFGTVYTLAAVPVGPPGITPDARSLFAFSSQTWTATGGVPKQVMQYTVMKEDGTLITPINYVNWNTELATGDTGSGGGVVGPYGEIIATSITRKLLIQWGSSRVRIRPTQLFGEQLAVRFNGATA